MGVREEKQELRNYYKQIRAEINPEDKSRLDAMICKILMSALSYRHTDGILSYVSMPEEIDTHTFILSAINSGKSVAVPRCVKGTPEMHFYRINSFDDLSPGVLSIPEPLEYCKLVDINKYKLCIVPAFTFDLGGYRIGYGGGYYDRFLEEYEGVTAGLIYSSNIVKAVPRGRFDKRVDLLITEKGIMQTNIALMPNA